MYVNEPKPKAPPPVNANISVTTPDSPPLPVNANRKPRPIKRSVKKISQADYAGDKDFTEIK